MYLLIITTLFLLLLLTIHRMILTHHRLRRHLPPGPYSLTTTIPFIGETLQLISAYKTENPEPFTDDRVSRFGSIFTTHLFGEPTVFSADPEINRFILGTEGKYFESSYPSSIQNLIGKHSLLLMRGGLHKRMHSLTMSFGNSSIIRDHLLVDIDRLIRMNLDSWVRGVDDDDTVTTNHGHVFLMEEAKKITFALTMKQLMSFDPCEWTESLRKEYLLVIEGFFSIPLPFFPTTYNRAIKARTKVVEALRLVVRQRRKESQAVKKDNSSNETRLKKKDMLGALLEEDQGGGGGGFTDEEIVDFLVALLVAGYETTSIIMTLAVKFLTETPMALAQLKEEQDSIRAKKKRDNNTEEESLTWDDYKSMPFTQCVVNETLRVANIIGGIFRRTTTDVQVRGGYTIPKGWKVFASFRAVHMNEDYYKDARSFYPWRWQTDDGEPTPTACPKSTVFTPFGGGPRLCPGYEIARVSISVFLHHLVTTYSWSPTEDDKLVFFPTTRTQKRYPIKVQKRHDIASSSLL